MVHSQHSPVQDMQPQCPGIAQTLMEMAQRHCQRLRQQPPGSNSGRQPVLLLKLPVLHGKAHQMALWL